MTGRQWWSAPTAWRPPDGDRPVLQQAHMAWDAVKVRDRELADAVLTRLGGRTGSVIRDSRSGITYWLVELGSADRWPLFRGVAVLGRGGYLAVPPATLTGPPGPHWRVPFAPERCLTPAGTLRAALRLTPVRARRAVTPSDGDAYLHARVAEANRWSEVRGARPWG